MSKNIAVITLHGMGERKPEYEKELKEILIDKLGNQWDSVAFEAVQYQSVLQSNQDRIWKSMKSEFDLDGTFLRRFLMNGFSDAGSLEFSARSNTSNQYIDTQKSIITALDQIFIQLGRSQKPVIILAQSLGCQVISNYIWDAQNGKGIFDGHEPDGDEEMKVFRRLPSCVQLITTGCNIPMFVAGLDPIEPILAPSPEFTWDNYFDADDVLGWPLSPLSDGYAQLVTDYEINAGGFFSSRFVTSHGEYWTDRDVIKPLIKKIRSYL